MQAVLAARPASFPSLQAACEWALRSGTCKSKAAAGVSLPSQLVQVGSGLPSYHASLPPPPGAT
jgi:hypothetical protein